MESLDVSCGSFHFDVVVTSASRPEWDRPRCFWQQVEECLTMVKGYNFILSSMNDVYRASKTQENIDMKLDMHSTITKRIACQYDAQTYVKSFTRSTLGNRSPMPVKPISSTTRITDKNGL